MKERKHEAPPRYDAAFKEGAIRLVAEEGRPMREVAEELGVCTDTMPITRLLSQRKRHAGDDVHTKYTLSVYTDSKS